MDQLKKLYASLSLTQRILIVAGCLGAVVLIFSMLHWSRERDFKPLYSGLAQEDAAAVVAKVRESGSEFRLSDNGSTVLVPSAKVDEIRLQLAAQGIPHTGRIGYELFDKVNLNTSDFAEQVNYHRALEGELERSIMAISAVELARVHLTLAKDSIFLESKQPAKASVLVKLRPGGKLLPQHVAAICQLTASAVEGLAPEAVSIVDMRGNLLNRPHRTGTNEEAEAEGALEYREKVERDLLAKINTTLEPLLGAEKFRAAVFADCDLTSGEQSEETFDPAKSVMVASQKTEDVSGGNLSSGVPGSPSALPRPTSRPGSTSAGVSRRTENINFQSSRVVRHVKLPQGALKRLSVSLLLDNNVHWEGTGPKAKRIVEAPSTEKLKSIRDLVAGVIGFSQDRGDQLIVESLPFESTLNQPALPVEMPAAPVKPQTWKDLLQNKTMLMVGGGGAFLGVALATTLLLFVKRGKRASTVTEMGPAVISESSTTVDVAKQIAEKMAEREALQKQQELEALNVLAAPIATKKTEVLTKHIAEQAKKDSSPFANVVRTWISEQGTR